MMVPYSKNRLFVADTKHSRLKIGKRPVSYFKKIIRVRFFNKIQDWDFDPRSSGFVTIKETKNPKKDFLS